MKSLAIPIMAGVALAATLGGWVALPMLQSEQATVDADTSKELERARRLLHLYNAGIDYKSMLLSGLAESGVDVDVKDPAALDAVSEDFERQVNDAWKLYGPMDWGDDPRPAKSPSGQASQKIKTGISSRKELVKENGELLDQALKAVDEALSRRSSGSSAATHDAALRLKSVILQQFGLRESMRAELARSETLPLISELVAIATEAGSIAPSQQIVAGSGVVEQIKGLQERVVEIEAKLAEEKASLSKLDAKIASLTAEIEGARKQADNVRKSMEEVRVKGMNLTDPRSVEAYEASSRALREALSKTNALEYGDYIDATIDASGDYLAGAYVSAAGAGSPTVTPGRRHFESERAIQLARVEGGQRALADLKADVARLESMKSTHEATQSRGAQVLSDLQGRGAKVVSELGAIDENAKKIEDKALKYFSDSAVAGRDAARAAGRWISEAQSRTRDFSPEAKGRSGVAHRLQDDWIEGFTLAHVADALAGKGRIYAIRFQNYIDSQRAVSEAATALQLPESHVEGLKTRAKEAQLAGIEAVNDAMKTLGDVHRKVDNHWTISAQAAGTMYLLVLLGEPEYAQQAAEAYRTALKGREDKPFAEGFLSRLKNLESRKP